MQKRTAALAGAATGFAVGLAGGAAAGVLARPKPKAPEPTKPVDAERLFSGRWAELARTPSRLTDGCVAGAANYALISATKIAVRDTCRQGSPYGDERSMPGTGTILDPGANTKYRVHYRLFGILPFTLEFWVLDRDEDYGWFIAADPAFKLLWIFARDPRMDREVLNGLIRRAAVFGYDTARLEIPAQP